MNTHYASIPEKRRIDARRLKPIHYFKPGQKQWWRNGIQPKRDSQRQKCYDSERQASPDITHKKFRDVEEVAQYISNFMSTKWFQKRFPWFEECRITYLPGTSNCSASSNTKYLGNESTRGVIHLSRWGMGCAPEPCHLNLGGELVVLHELAHAVLPNSERHGRRWARTYLEFVGNRIGKDAKNILRDKYIANRVRYSPLRKSNVSFEQCERLAACRKVRQGKKT